jgi:hypothetical protein
MKQDSSAKIKSFWKWFAENETRIRGVLDTNFPSEKDALINDLDNQILEFGMFTWEIGYEPDHSFFLIISPNGNWERLGLSRSIMKLAPNLDDWHFYYAKPAKEWNLQFSLFDNNVIEHQVNASNWTYILIKQGDKFKIIIAAGNIAHLDYDTRNAAGDLVVTNLLGEELKIIKIAEIEMVNAFEKTLKAPSFPILSLKAQVENL